MELIDLTTWDRALHYQIFRNSAQPQYCVSFELDITNFLTAIREKGYSFTHISHTDSGSRDNATPLCDWGRYFERDGRTLLPFSVQVHHSFVDGVHIGKLAKLLLDYLDCFCSTSV
ncbi:CatA-like O-acetyltransferase [Hungatella hathewayi]|uniref:CatA-like O-acetyltransferase n=1 Tax=Hungatella hathewayi TaxID=154046 RepID=UPI003564BCE4